MNNTQIWCHFKQLAKLPVIGERQSLDCDRSVVLMTKHPVFFKKYRCSNKLLKKMKSENLHDECRGMHITCNPKEGSSNDIPSYNIIFIDHMISGDKKLLSVIVHEVSHLVDFQLDNASVNNIDTELRAYMMDYYVGEIFAMMNFSFGTTTKATLTARQKIWGKKLRKLKAKLVKKLGLKHSGELYTIATSDQIMNSGVKDADKFFEIGPRV